MGDNRIGKNRGFPERYWFHIGESPVLSQPGMGRLGKRNSGAAWVRGSGADSEYQFFQHGGGRIENDGFSFRFL